MVLASLSLKSFDNTVDRINVFCGVDGTEVADNLSSDDCEKLNSSGRSMVDGTSAATNYISHCGEDHIPPQNDAGNEISLLY